MRASAFSIPLRDKLVQTVVTSPSYFGLRRYPGGTENDLGREKTIALYVEHLVIAMREVWRVLKNDGVVFLNLGDSYHGSSRGAGKNGTNEMKMNPLCAGTPLRGQGEAKSLCLIPHRVMIALEDDGWIIRNDVIWAKPNCVPDSVDDRCTSSYEHVIVMTKQRKYYWNAEEAREPSVCWEKGSLGGGHTPSWKDGKMKYMTMRHSNKVGSSKTARRLPPIGNKKHQALGKPTLVGNRMVMKPTRNLRDVWLINTRPHKEEHIAMFPEALVERCIRIGSRPGDWVLDCFAGSGTTGVVARELRRNAILLDISADYCQMMKTRLSQQPEPLESLPVAENKANESNGDPVSDFEPRSPQPRRKRTVVINQEFVSWSRTYSGPKFHAALSDFPYGYHFMSATWDDPQQSTKNQVHLYPPSGRRMTTVGENIQFQSAVRTWGEAMLPLLFPGALVMIFAGPRMWEWVATGMQMAGFEHWDTIMWLRAQGFPKAMDIGRQVAKLTGQKPIGEVPNPAFLFMKNSGQTAIGWRGNIPETKQVYDNEWEGRKTPAMKPAYEPILCFRAPRCGMTYAELATRFGTGTLNIDGARIGTGAKKWDTPKGGIWHASEPGDQRLIDNPLGHYPPNAIFDEESANILDEQTGGASRFFYVAKASKRERNAGCEDLPNDHPCLKPLHLTRYLASLLLPPASVAPRRLLVPFAGSGSEMIGGEQAGWDEVVGVEQNPHYCEIAELRLGYWRIAVRPSSSARNVAA